MEASEELLTSALKQALDLLDLLDIRVLDHIVVASDKASFRTRDFLRSVVNGSPADGRADQGKPDTSSARYGFDN